MLDCLLALSFNKLPSVKFNTADFLCGFKRLVEFGTKAILIDFFQEVNISFRLEYFLAFITGNGICLIFVQDLIE